MIRSIRWRVLAAGCILVTTSVLGQETKPTDNATAPIPFTTLLKKTVVFIRTNCNPAKDDPNQIRKSYAGTGFFVFVRDPRLGENKGFRYLITNRHVAQPGIEDAKPCDVASYSVRLNLKPQPGHQIASAELNINDPTWFYPENAAVDLAVLPTTWDHSMGDFEDIPSELIADEKDDALQEGDQVLFAGLFIQYAGVARIQPIVRSGSIAMLPDELTPTTLKKLGHVYFTEAHVYGGNSGSPVFVDVAGPRRGKPLANSYKLLGVVAGEVHETDDLQIQVSTTLSGEVSENSGISEVVPGGEIKSLLEDPRLRSARDAVVAKSLSSQR